MSKRLRESVFSKTEPKDTNVVWYQPTEEGIKEKIYNGGWKEVRGNTIQVNGSGNTDKIIREEQYYNDGSGQLVPIKHPDLSTQPSILPYKFMGQYVYEQLIPISEIYDGVYGFITGDDNLEWRTKVYLDCGVSAVPMGGYASHYFPAKLRVDTAYDNCIQFIFDVQNLEYDKDTYKMYARVVYTSMPEEEVYYYDNANDNISFLSDFSFDVSEETYILTSDGYRYPFTLTDMGTMAYVPRHHLEIVGGGIQFNIPNHNISKITDGFGTYVTLSKPNFILTDEFKPFIGSTGIRFYRAE